MKPATKTKKPLRGKQAPKPRTLLQQLAQMPQKLFNDEFRRQCGALCFRRNTEDGALQILLVTSRDSGRWIIPKGWQMKKKQPHEAAEIEAWQEAGVRGRAKKKPIGRYTYLKWLDNGDVAPCIVDVFQIEVTEIEKNYKERGQRELAWLSPEEAAYRVREVELKSLIIDFKPKKR